MLGRTLYAPGLLHLFGLPVALALTLGCTPKATTPPETPAVTPPPKEVPPPKRIDRQLEAIADEIDPGEVEPVITAMPEWLATGLRPHVPEGEAAADTLSRAREQLTAWEKDQAQGSTGVGSLVKLGAAIYLGETLLLADSAGDPDILAHLQKLYTILDQPFFTGADGFFKQSLGLIVDVAAREGVLAQQQQVGELLTFFDAALSRAGPLKRRSAAQLLRDHPDHPDIPRVLGTLADEATRRQDFDRAIELSKISLARDRNNDHKGIDYATHSMRCYTALDVEAGDKAREDAIAHAPAAEAPRRAAYDAKMGWVEKKRARAIEATTLATVETIEGQLRRGHVLLLLGRHDDAAKLYEELKGSYPKDARPYAGLTKVALARDFNFMGELPIHSARALENKDRDFYEVALGLSSGRLMAEVIPAASEDPDKIDPLIKSFLAEVRENAEAWATYEPGRAAVLIALTEVIGKTLPLGLKGNMSKLQPALRRLVADFDRVRKQHPEIRDSWQATYVAVLFAKSKVKAWKTAIAPLPESLADDVELQQQRLETLRNIIFLWEQGDPIADLEAALATVPETMRTDDVVIETGAMLDYLRLRGGDTDAGLRATTAYSDLASRRKGAEKAQALTNLGVLYSLSGNAAAAISTWEQAIAIADERGRDIIYLNAAIQGLGPGMLQSLETLSASRHSGLIRLQALAWRSELASRSGEGAQTALEEYRAAVISERSGEMRANLPLAGYGVLSTGDFTANLGYSVEDALEITLSVNADPWLIPPAPLTVPGGDKGKGKGKTKPKTKPKTKTASGDTSSGSTPAKPK